MKFKELTKKETTLKAIDDMGYKNPTTIQKESINVIRDGHDLIAQSQTGTGKTAAFAIPTIEKINKKVKGLQVLVICPTRELAMQVASEYKKLVKYDRDIRVISVYGGEQISKQIRLLKDKPQIVVGTPGRLQDHFRRRTIRLDNIHTLILDEADEMLKMGFREEIESIYDQIKNSTQNIMFSATIPKAIANLANKYLNNPVRIEIEAKGIATETVKQSYVAIQKKYKKAVIRRLLDAKMPKRCLIFCNTKKMVDDLIVELQDAGYSADRIHGDLKQEQRIAVLNQFNKGALDVLVATDVAGRGLDIQKVDLVINYDIPEKEDSYVHRIGRSGRAGREGEAITLVLNKEKTKLKSIEGYMKKDISHVKVPSLRHVNESKVEHLLTEVLTNLEDGLFEEYMPIVDKVKQRGYSLKQLCVALLNENLNLHDLKNEQDFNDHSFHKKKPHSKSKNNRRRSKSRRNRRNRR